VLINSFTVNSATSITANITVNESAPAGQVSVTATTLGEVATGINVFTITNAKLTATINVTPYNVTYDGNAHTAMGTATGVGGANLNAYLDLSGTTHTSAGTYSTDGWSFTDPNGTYAPASGTISDKITQATGTVNLGSLAQTYTGSPLSATATTTPSGMMVSFTYNGSSTAPTAAGSYTVVGTISNANYTGSASGTMVISPAAATVTLTPSSLTQTYTGSPLSAAATTNPSGIAVSFTYNGSSTAPTAAGSYTVVGTINSANYTGSATGTLVISQATATVTLTPSSLTQTYTGSPISTVATTNPSGITVNFTYNGSSTAPTEVGSYPVVGTISNANYTGTATGTLVISPATATINVTPYNVTYDGAAHTAAGTATGVGGANLNADLTLSGTTHTIAGTYATDGWSFTDPSGNYAPASGTVSDTIPQATGTVNLGSLAQTYTGSPLSATATTTPSGMTVNFTYNGSSTAPTAAGSYTVVGTINNANYTGTATGTLVISQATATINITPYNVTYNGAVHTATGTATGVGGANLNAYLTLSSTTHTIAGTYASDAWSFTDPSGNYAPASGTVSDTITPATATFNVTSYNVTYDGNAHMATGTATGVGGANLNAYLTLSGTTHTIAGTYATDGWSFTDPSGNYATASGTVSDTITPATATINITPYNVTYDSNPHTATGTATGVGGVNLNADLTLSGSTHSDAGTYPSDPWSFTDPSGNYAPASGTVSDTINPQVPTLTFATIPSHTYGDAPFQVSATDASSTPSNGAITYSLTIGPTSSGTVTSLGMVTLTGAGTVYLTASQAASGNYAAATATTSFTVNPAVPTLTFATIPTHTYGDAPFQVTATDAANTPSSGMITYSLTNGQISAGTVSSSGTVTLIGSGTVYLTANQMASGNYAAATATTSFTVDPPLMITSNPLPAGVVGTSYSQTLTATGGSGAYTSWAVTANNSGLTNLGLSLTSSSGVWSISGLSSSLVAGSATFTVQVTDSIGATTTQQLTINVYEPLSLPAPNPASLGFALTSQYYNGSISGSGGSGNYSWSVTGLSSTGLSYNSTGNTLNISGTAPATAQTLTLNVTMTDTATSQFVTQNGYTITVINPNVGYPVSGTVSYGGPDTGWIYLQLSNNNCNNCGGNLGTAIHGPGAFTIQGVPPGTYTLQAYMDNLGYGGRNVSNPIGSTQNVVVSYGPLSGVTASLSNPATVTLGTATPTWDPSQGFGAFSGGAIVYFDPICNGNGCNNGGIEMPASYTVQWSANSSFSPVAGSQCFPATGSQNPWIVSGISGSGPYYFRAAGNMGTCGSSTSGLTWSAASSAMTIGAPSSGNLVQGTVTFSAPAGGITGPLYVGFYDMSTGNIYTDVVGSQASPPISPASYSVYVPTGSNYYFFGVIDQNDNGLMIPGNISNTNEQNMATVDIDPAIPSTLTQNLALPSSNGAPTNAQVIVKTQSIQQTDMSGNVSYGYNVGLRVDGLYKLPASVDLYSGPSYIVNAPADIATGAFNGNTDEWAYNPSINGGSPSTSDVFTFNVTYTDGTSNSTANSPSNPLAASPSAVLSAWTTNMSPAWNTGSASTQPTFTWNYPTGAANYTYQFQLQDSNRNTIWSIPAQGQHSDSSGFSSNITPSITWGVDPTGGRNTPSVTSLNGSSTYYWQIQATDANGNEATTQMSFQTAEVPLSLPASGALGSGTVNQAYNGSITASGGSGTGYSFTVGVNGAGATGGTSWTLPNGLSASSNGGILTISGTPTTTPATITLAVGVTDSESHTASGTYTISIVSSQVTFPATGNVSYDGTQTGWVFLALIPTNNCNNNGCSNPIPGTAISAATLASGGAFTIHGVQPGTYNLTAWMDTLGYGVGNASDPSGSTSVTVTNSTLSGASVSMHDSVPLTLTSAPTWLNDEGMGMFSGGAIVPVANLVSNGVQIPTSYILEYSTDSTFNTGVSSKSFPAAHADHHWIVTGLTNGDTYYFRAAGVVGSGSSAVTGPWSSAYPAVGLWIGTPTEPNTVQGTITFSQAPTGPLYVAFLDYDTNIIFTKEIASPVSPQAYSINLPNSSNYGFFAILDQKNAGWNAQGDISNYGGNGPAPVSVTGSMSGVNLTLPSGNSFDTLTTGHWTEIDNYGALGTHTYGGYNLYNYVDPVGKRPVAVELLSGPNVTAPEDLAESGTSNTLFQFYSTFNPNSTPTVGDPYIFQVTYSDGTSETLTQHVSGFVSVPTNLSPAGPGSSTTPTFTWTGPANASNYVYQFGLQDANGNAVWDIPSNQNNRGGFPGSDTSITWGVDPTGASNAPTVSSLTSGSTYWWWIEAIDPNGNWSQTSVDYVPGYTPLALPAPNPSTLGTTSIGQPYTGTIIASGGFAPYYWSVNGCQWNCAVSIGNGLTASYTGYGNNTLTISGTPNATGSVSFPVYVYDSTWTTPTATYTYTINITTPPLKLTSAAGTTYAFVGQPFSQLYSASGGSGSGYHFTVNSQTVPTDGTSVTLTNGDGLTAAMSSANTLNISGTPTGVQNVMLSINLKDSQSHSATSTFYVDVVAQPSGANNGNLSGTYVCKIDGFNDRDGSRWASLASFYADSGSLSNGVWDNNGRDFTTAISGTLSGAYSIGADNNGMMTTNYTLTSDGTGSGTNTWAIALSNAGEPASPAQEFHMVESDDVGINASGQHATGDCYLANTGAFAAGTIGSNGFAFGIQGEDHSGTPKAYVGRFTAVAGNSGGTISTGIIDGMGVNQSGDQGGSITGGSYTVPGSATGRFTFALSAGDGSVNFAGYIIDANRMFVLSIDPVSDNAVMDGDMRTQQQSTYTGANMNNNFVLYWQSYGYQNGSIAGYGTTVLQGTGDGAGNFTINQSYDDQNGTYKVGDEVGGPIAMNFDSSNPGRASFSPGGGMIYMYFFDNNSAFFLNLNGGSPSSLDTGWMEPQTQTTFTNATLAGNYLYGYLPVMISTMYGGVGDWNFDNAGNVTGENTSAGKGIFQYDMPLSGWTYSWLSTTYGTFSMNGNRSCAIINSTRAACIYNNTTTPFVMILQQ
jgi:hypothetical protein